MDVIGVNHSDPKWGKEPDITCDLADRISDANTVLIESVYPTQREYYDNMPEIGAPYSDCFEGSQTLTGHKLWVRIHDLFPLKKFVSIDSADLYKRIMGHLENSCQAKIRIVQAENEFSQPAQVQASIDLLVSNSKWLYDFYVSRDAHLSGQVTANPDADLCIVGKLHALPWYFNDSFPSTRFFIDDTDYEEDKLCNIREAGSVSEDLDFFRIDRLKGQIVTRDYNLWSTGNFIPDSRPIIRGTWMPVNPLEGYFEIYSDDLITRRFQGEFRGVCYDGLGEAVIVGHVQSDKLRFTKEYLIGHQANHDSTVEYEFKLSSNSFSKGVDGKFTTEKDRSRTDSYVDLGEDSFSFADLRRPVQRLSLVERDVRDCNISFGSFEHFLEQNLERFLVCAGTQVSSKLHCGIRGYHITDSFRDPKETISMLFCQNCGQGMPDGCGFKYMVDGTDKIIEE